MRRYLHEYLRRLRLLAWNESEDRPRAFVRIYLFWLVYTVIFLSLPALINPSGTGLLRAAGLRALLVLCTAGLIVGAATFLDRRSVHDFGLSIDRQWVTDAVVGALIGLAIPTGAVLIGLTKGWLAVADPTYTPLATFLGEIGLAIVVTVCVATTEELVFRGYILTNAIEGLDLRWFHQPMTIASAWGFSALLFAGAHPAPTLINGLHYLGAGILLGLAYLITGQLALPIGIHAGFNFASGYVFPIGQNPSVTVVPLTVHGPGWLLGQTGALQTGLQIVAAFLIVVYVWWQSGGIGITPTVKSRLKNKR